VAAVQGLAETRTPEAIETLKSLQGDKDRDVNAATTHALLRIMQSSAPPPSAQA
jgi:HEAT repeat protein